jgi:intracellular septation protein
MEKQQPQVIPILKPFLKGLSFRTGLFFLIHAVWAAWAAFYASTRFWAFLKGLGLPLTFVIYFVIEFLIMRKKIMIQKQKLEDAELASASPSSLLNEDIKN